jgi:hypothetical protein
MLQKRTPRSWETTVMRILFGLAFLALVCACVSVSLGVALTTQPAYAGYGP